MRKLLVANRGEIALRIMRSAREMGIGTVAVFSEADRRSPHVQYADEAICIGPAPAGDSYLSPERILRACRESGADAVHPGYGFLSENAAFAHMVQEAGLCFVGPPARAIELMGNKLEARRIAMEHGIPVVPGTESAINSLSEAHDAVRKTGFPVLIKAAAGGGGKGMRIVKSEDELEDQMSLAISEASSAFGDGSVFIEKYLASPRHVEIQVLADTQGKAVHVFERECSIQRRHQKVVEEAPSPAVDPALREAMGSCAVKLCGACGYTGAGTVEFILDGQGKFYFLEMNTRLQVEHPVSELITGLDLVKEQLKIARGEGLSFSQQDLAIRGHAIELRVYAEDPANSFLPDIGRLHHYRLPAGAGVRVDDGYEQGMEIPIHYDPLIAKLIVHASTRDEAIARMIRAISEYRISGVETTLAFGRFVMEHPAFRSGNFDTHFVSDHFLPSLETQEERGAPERPAGEGKAAPDAKESIEELVSSIIVNNLIKRNLNNRQCQNGSAEPPSRWVLKRKSY